MYASPVNVVRRNASLEYRKRRFIIKAAKSPIPKPNQNCFFPILLIVKSGFKNPFISISYFGFIIAAPGSLCPQRTVRASFPAYSSGTFKALPAKGPPTVLTIFISYKNSHLSAFFCTSGEGQALRVLPQLPIGRNDG
jgi:hypothetical protein